MWWESIWFYPKKSRTISSPEKSLTKAVATVATPQANMIKDSQLAAFVFSKIILEGISKMICKASS